MGRRGSYAAFIGIEHGKENRGLMSAYPHVVPLIKEETLVKKGDVIATLYKDPGDKEGGLVHLHFGLINSWESYSPEEADPKVIDKSLYKYNAVPQGSIDFTVPELPVSPSVEIAHFKKLTLEYRRRSS